ncbi:alpha/beta fold hydrolase [Amycolatopsis pithecellobii]|uniref:alpha/beta fold hydrolase n=1 Tax=Amycolatopsis pithecellobii TaxID=664692 RepID=UPI00140CBCEB|nr:alpha/beta hydrolase [Amycolatopsis pithecellobii]
MCTAPGVEAGSGVHSSTSWSGPDTRSTPTLTGLGRDAPHLRPNIALEEHIDVVADCVSAAGDEVILVGHSYGTIPACGAAATSGAGPSVRRLVFLDGFIPTPGRSVFDDRPDVEGILEGLAASHDGLYAEPAPPAAYGIDDDEVANWLQESSTLMPMSVLRQPFPTDLKAVDELGGVNINYIRFTGTDLFMSAKEVAIGKGWRFSEIEGNHFAFVTRPVEVAAEISFDVR